MWSLPSASYLAHHTAILYRLRVLIACTLGSQEDCRSESSYFQMLKPMISDKFNFFSIDRNVITRALGILLDIWWPYPMYTRFHGLGSLLPTFRSLSWVGHPFYMLLLTISTSTFIPFLEFFLNYMYSVKLLIKQWWVWMD